MSDILTHAGLALPAKGTSSNLTDTGWCVLHLPDMYEGSDEEGNPTLGCHVNLSPMRNSKELPGIADFVVNPENPRFKIAGEI